MMKKKMIKNWIFVLIIIFALNSCDKNLLMSVPTDRVTPLVFWNDEDDFNAAIAAVYNQVVIDGFTYGMWDGMSDIGHVVLQWRDESHIELGAFDSQIGPVKKIWDHNYAAIRAANDILEHLEEFEGDDEFINQVRGECFFLRGFFYTKLVSLYGGVPLIDKTITSEEGREITRSSLEDSWDFVESDLKKASELLPEDQEKIGKATKGAALALLGRAMLYAERFKESYQASQQVMDLNRYELYPQYEKLFSYEAENNVEVIFDKQYLEDLQPNDIFAEFTPNSLFPQVSNYAPNRRIVDAYYMKNGLPIGDPNSGYDPLDPAKGRDPRLGYSIFTTGDIMPNGRTYDPTPGSGTGDEVGSSENSTPTGYNIKKYINPEDIDDPTNCGINFILIRYGEVLLNYAEAKIESSEIDQSVLDAINEIRNRPDVNMPNINQISNQEEMREIVRHERLVELAFESKRYIDIRRWRIAEDVMPGTIVGMDYLDGSGNLKTVEVTGFDRQFDKNRDYLWPIPNTEIELNSNLEQNPNW